MFSPLLERLGIRRPGLLPGLLLAGLTFLLFWPAIRYGFVNLDDTAYIAENQMIHNGLTWPAIQGAFTSIYESMWAPGLWLSYMLDIELFGPTHWGNHLTNILLHSANALLAFILFLRWTRKPWRAFFAAAIWAWHPLRVESVAWVSARKDVLSGFFFLLCLLAYDLAWRAPSASDTPPPPLRRRTWTAASLFFLAAGLTVKPMLVTTPAVLLLLDIWPLRRLPLSRPEFARTLPRLVAEKAFFWMLIAVSSALAVFAHAQSTSLAHLSLGIRLLGMPLHYVFYLLKTVLPLRLTILYPGLPVHFVGVLAAVLLLSALTLLAWDSRRRSLAPLVGWLWFLGVMVPTSGIIRFGVQSLADRFTYLPALGLSLMLLPLWPARRTRGRGIRLAAAAALLLAAAALTRQQLPVWRDSNHLFDHLLRYSPDHAFGLTNRARHLQQQGRLPEAEALMRRAAASPTGSDMQKILLADILASMGRPGEAVEYLQSVTLLSPGSSAGKYHFTLAMALNQMNRLPEAARQARRAADAISPHDLIRRDLDLLGMVIAVRMNDPDAAREWARSLPQYRGHPRIGEDDLLPYYIGQWKRLQREEAIGYFRKYLARHSEDAGALNNLAWLLATSEWSPLPPDEIVGYARRATELNPANPVLLDTLAAALAHAGRFEQAEQTVRQARTIVREAGYEGSELDRTVSRHLHAYQQQKPWREEDAVESIGRILHAP